MSSMHNITRPIERDMVEFDKLFRSSLTSADGLLQQALDYVLQRSGKRMRPVLVMLMMRHLSGMDSNGSEVLSDKVFYAASTLELLHTASLVHDDVVDDSNQRRGQASVNAIFNNKVSVLVGDYILSTALLNASLTDEISIVNVVSALGQQLAWGEVEQLQNTSKKSFSLDAYYDVISKKTASLFCACCEVAAVMAKSSDEERQKAIDFGHDIGMIFQIRDDIFDYVSTAEEIGKPVGNDMQEGKLTLPVLHVLQGGEEPSSLCAEMDHDELHNMQEIAHKVRSHEATKEEIAELVKYTIENGGLEYAEEVMDTFYAHALEYINDNVKNVALAAALRAYLDFVRGRKN